MKFNVKYSNQAIKFLKKSEKIIVKRILDKIDFLLKNPLPKNMDSVKGTDFYRVRVGSYRILYEVDYNENIIGIIKIEKRSRMYS